MTTSPVMSTTTTVLSTNTDKYSPEQFVIRLATSNISQAGSSSRAADSSRASSSKNFSSGGTPRKCYPCTFEGCTKAYSKPSRLAEHERSHTGDRPFVCQTCNKSYLRENHLQAHLRSHMDKSERPFVCEELGCDKRFWTAQHLRAHTDLHTCEKPFQCTEDGCDLAFAKHHQLREHACLVHAPPGTKSFRCPHNGCDKSFETNQKLRIHLRTHDDKRYICTHSLCSALQSMTPAYYSTWSALQNHMRVAHPPTCPYAACKGRAFGSQKGLRAHLKLHEQRQVEEELRAEEDEEPPRKKRRGGEIGRDWVCDVEGCLKDFKSKKALANHQKVNHLGLRDFVCPHDTCKRAFGYKHLLQRHLAKIHDAVPEPVLSTSDDDQMNTDAETSHMGIDDITGKTYATHSRQRLAENPRVLRCPHPDISGLLPDAVIPSRSGLCEYTFSRAYDLRRHLASQHNVEVQKEAVEKWVQQARFTHAL